MPSRNFQVLRSMQPNSRECSHSMPSSHSMKELSSVPGRTSNTCTVRNIALLPRGLGSIAVGAAARQDAQDDKRVGVAIVVEAVAPAPHAQPQVLFALQARHVAVTCLREPADRLPDPLGD